MSNPETSETPWWHTASLPVLLQIGRRAYGQRIRAALGDAEMADMPRQGPRVVSGIDRKGTNVRDVAAELGVSKQAASKLVDALVEQGYVERVPDPDDRRVITIGLTARGKAAAKLVRKAVDSVDAELSKSLGDKGVFAMRCGLAVLLKIVHEDREAGRGGEED